MEIKINQTFINVLLFAMIIALFVLSYMNRQDIYNLKLVLVEVVKYVQNPFLSIGVGG